MIIEQKNSVKKPYKILGLSIGKKKTGGRNNQGRITAFHRGGGNKLRYIYINKSTVEAKNKSSALDYNTNQLFKFPRISIGPFNRKLFLGPFNNKKLEKKLTTKTPVYNSGEVRYLVRDPNRTAWIAGIYWSGNSNVEQSDTKQASTQVRDTKNLWYSYYSNIIAPEGLTIGATITNTTSMSKLANKDTMTFDSAKAQLRSQVSLLSQTIGNKSFLKDLMIGTIIHNIDGKYIRSAGCSGIIISKSHEQGDISNPSDNSVKVTVKLQSGQYKVFPGETLASIGVISNGEHKTRDLRKAGQKRWLGRRPIVRGVAMNPVDHPHGGGEGKSSGGRPSVTPWGKPTKGKPTRSSKRNPRKLTQLN